MSRLSWLHLTDLHRGLADEEHLWPGVENDFYEDIETLHRNCGPWDLVLFTGDLTQRGTAAEFASLNSRGSYPQLQGFLFAEPRHLRKRLDDLGCPLLPVLSSASIRFWGYLAHMPTADNAELPSLPVEHVRRLVEADRLGEARRYVEERLAQGDTSVETWARLLRPPTVKPSSYRPIRDFGADNAWMRKNREAFRGRWVALASGELLDSDVEMKPLVDRLIARGALEGTLVVQVG